MNGNYVKDDRDLLADELERLIATWRKSLWLMKISLAHEIVVKIALRLKTITQALRGGEGK